MGAIISFNTNCSATIIILPTLVAKEIINTQKSLINLEVYEAFLCFLVGVTGFEPTTSSSRTKRATGLRYTPKTGNIS